MSLPHYFVQALAPLTGGLNVGWSVRGTPDVLQLADHLVHQGQKLRSARMWHAGDEFAGLLRKGVLVRTARPPAHIAVGQQRQTTEVVSPTRVPKIPEDIIELQLECGGQNGVHVAVQHELDG
jgi:hypothetical protein